MTERLYYNDSELFDFDAVVTYCGVREGRHYALLDRSAFYPTSGGQSHDTGLLGGVSVVEVTVEPDGEVVHWTGTEVGAVGDKVTGRIDRERRVRNSQNHSGQHLLSAAFDALYSLRTASVHLGEEYAAVELETATLSEDQLIAAEDKCNEVIGANLDIETIFVEASESGSYPLRKPPPKEGRLRIIRVGNFECSACGGTHCRTTGGICVIKIITTEKIRGHTLVKFLTGRQAYEDYRLRFDITNQLARDLTCHPGDLPGKIGKLGQELREVRANLLATQKELIPFKVEKLVSEAVVISGQAFLFSELEGFDASQAPKVALQIADRINGVVVFVLNSRMMIAVPEGSSLEAGAIARELAEGTSLKGGGNARQAQLGGADPKSLKKYRSILEKVLSDA